MLGTKSSHAQLQGDAVRGARVFQRCYACHSIDPTERHHQGPNLYGVVGRRVGVVDGYEYSDAMLAAGRAGMKWDEQTLDTYLTDAEETIVGTKMGPMKLREQDRADVIAYLKKAGGQ